MSIAFELSIALLVVTLPFTVQAGIFTGWLQETVETATVDAVQAEAAIDVSLLSSTQNPDPIGGSEADILIEENALVSSGPVSEEDMAVQAESSDEISVYTVREGDSLSEIAQMFGVTSNTILWANDLKKKTDISPGDELIILPIAGVRHVVKRGDTIDTIAQKYGGEAGDILSYNQLASASEIVTGETLIIPGGELHTEVAVTTKGKGTATKSSGKSNASAGFINPAPGAVKTQGIHGNNAVDLAGSMGLTIRAAAAGQVIVAKGGSGWNGGYGNYVVIKHSNGTQTLYAHLSSLSVGSGAYVEQGETIGGMGNTGKSTGTHLHFEVRGGRNPF